MGRIIYEGNCQLCSAGKTKASMASHLKKCAPLYDVAGGRPTTLFQLRVEARYDPMYWLDLEIRGDAKLADLDRFLRNFWLECCGHLSGFTIASVRYTSIEDQEDAFGDPERTMNHRLGKVLPSSPGQRFLYEYDYGTTTELVIRGRNSRAGRIGREALRLLAQNKPPVWPCTVCQEPSTLICSYCTYEGECFYCARHTGEHEHADEEVFLPVVNSPRMGVCGYTG